MINLICFKFLYYVREYYNKCIKQINDDEDKIKTKYGSLTFRIFIQHTDSGAKLAMHFNELRLLNFQQWLQVKNNLDKYKSEDLQYLFNISSRNLFGERRIAELEKLKNILKKKNIDINGFVSQEIEKQCVDEFERQENEEEKSKEEINIVNNNSSKGKITEYNNNAIYKNIAIKNIKLMKKGVDHKESLFSNQNIKEKQNSNNIDVIVDVVNSGDSQNQENKINNLLLQIERDNKKNNSILSSFKRWCGDTWDGIAGFFKDIKFSCNCNKQQINEDRKNTVTFNK